MRLRYLTTLFSFGVGFAGDRLARDIAQCVCRAGAERTVQCIRKIRPKRLADASARTGGVRSAARNPNPRIAREARVSPRL